MSRIGRMPIVIPQGVKVSIESGKVSVTGPQGSLERVLPANISVAEQDGRIIVTRSTDQAAHRALHGLVRSLIANMIEGVTKEFSKALDIVGIGYRAEMKSKMLEINIGYSHPVKYQVPDGIRIETPKPTSIIVTGIDKQQVGQVAAEIRRIRKPEPYKGKGIMYVGEQIRRKAGKKLA